ncbi:MAG TPA: TetR/AcrR family transcriptional regulator [Acidimicrobiales bacterium]|jgi:AcrR family transcriptional regulator|nr:TetR/AcrR family transcriptional regulator [Acidimicrobiales bacterium]
MEMALRRTQSERTAGTQEALLEAAIGCLVEFGYAKTTTRVVADRAGVSRGAQTHHYPTKTELVTAAIGYLFDQQARRFRDAFAALPEDRRTVDQALALLWEIVSGPSYAAVLEVTVAARTDAELRVVVHGTAAVLESTVIGLLREFFPTVQGELARTIIDIGFTLVQGAAVSSYAGYGDPERTIRLMKSVAALLTPEMTDVLIGALNVLDA